MLAYLITHAHTKQDSTLASMLWQLSPLGMHQIAVLADEPFWAEVSHVAVSSEAKTYLTVQQIATARGLPILVDCRFDELRRGGWVEDYVERVRHVLAQPDQAVGGWEPANHALRRFRAGIENLKTKFPRATVALVGHGLTLSLFRAALMGHKQVDVDAWRQLDFAAVGLADLERNCLLQDFRPAAGSADYRMIRG